MVGLRQRDFELDIPSKGDQLAPARNYIAELAREHGFNQSQVYDIKVAVGEAVANAIEHGSPRGAANQIKISCQPGSDFTVRIQDQGLFRRAVPGTQTEPNYRGHGILLMLALMDKVEIDESPEGTTVTLIKRSPAK